MPSPFPPGSLQPPEPEKRPSAVQRAKVPTFWAVIGVVLGAAVQYLLTTHGASPALADIAARAAQQAVERAAQQQQQHATQPER